MRAMTSWIATAILGVGVCACGGNVDTNAFDDGGDDGGADSSASETSVGADSAADTSIDTLMTTDSAFGADVPIEDVPTVSADVACQRLAEADCSRANACSKIYVDVLYGDVDTCTTRLKAACLRVLGAPGVHETPSMAAACASDIATLSCDDLYAKNLPASCDVPPGDAANGAACGDDEQCASSFCAWPGGATCGTCAAARKIGDDCVSGECGRTLACVSGKCQKAGKLGDSCDSKSNPCVADLSCFGGTCVAAASAGAACDANEKTNPACDQAAGLFCNPGTHVCQKLGEAKAGEACGADFAAGTFSVCTAGAVCRTTSGTLSGTCVAPAADGAECNSDASIGPECLSPARCVGTVCKLPDPAACK